MAEFNSRTGRHTALKQRMTRNSLSTDGVSGVGVGFDGVSGDGEEKGNSDVAKGSVQESQVESICL